MIVGELTVTASGQGGTATSTQNESEPSGAFLYGVSGGVEFRPSRLININLEIG